MSADMLELPLRPESLFCPGSALEWPRSYYFDKIAIADLCSFKIGTRSERDLNFILILNGMSPAARCLDSK